MLIYDIEIVNGILDFRKGESAIEGIKYCKGWDDHGGMGISVIGAYDYKEDRYRVFTDSNKSEFLKLIDAGRLLVGFNNIKFDNKVIRAAWGFEIDDVGCYDILQEVWSGAGLGSEYNHETHKHYGLDMCCRANFNNLEKTGHGALAPVMWQQGKIGDVIDYCLQDVRMTKILFDKILKDGYIVNPRDPEKVLRVKKPF